MGIRESISFSLMVAASALMNTYLQESWDLQRIIVFFKTLCGGGNPVLIGPGFGLVVGFILGCGDTV